MHKKFDENNKIGDIVTEFPSSSDIFYRYHIDFCCGGNRPLKDALEEQKLDSKEVLEAINSKYDEFTKANEVFTDWAKESPGKLIDYIVDKHHAYLREELPKASAYLLKILKVHGKGHEELFKVHRIFNKLRAELEEHLIKEEEFLFPLIKEYEKKQSPELKSKITEVTRELEEEHTGAGDILKELREITQHYTLPKDACRTFEMTYLKLKEIELDLFRHIHLENNILF